jgi:hypothetical protein
MLLILGQSPNNFVETLSYMIVVVVVVEITMDLKVWIATWTGLSTVLVVANYCVRWKPRHMMKRHCRVHSVLRPDYLPPSYRRA